MLILRCANGVVAWLLRGIDPEHAQAICQADQFTVALTRSATASWADSLLSIATHSAGLKGAVQQVLYLPPRIV
jgi:hypothetical protein